VRKRAAAAAGLAVVVACAVSGCAPNGPGTRLEPGFDSKSAGIRLVNGVIEAQFCDDYPVSRMAFGEYDPDLVPYFDLMYMTSDPQPLSAGQVTTLAGQGVNTTKTPTFTVGNEIEVVVMPSEGPDDMVASRFLIEEPGLPSELWLRPDGLLLVDPCA